MTALIFVSACIVAGAALHLYQVVRLLGWIDRRSHCAAACDVVDRSHSPVFGLISLSAEPPAYLTERCVQTERGMRGCCAPSNA